MAEAKVSGDVATYFGQYNSGAKNYTSHFANASEGHIKVSGTSGSLTGYLEVELRDDRYGRGAVKIPASTDSSGDTTDAMTIDPSNGNGTNFNVAQLNVKWQSDALSVQLGTVTNGVACTYAISSGLKTTTTVGLGTYISCSGYLEQDGIQVNYAIPAIKGFAGLTIAPTTMGQAMAISATGTLADMVGFRFNQTSYTVDDYSSADDTAVSNSAMHVGFMMPFGTMSVSLDISSKTNDAKNDYSSTAVQFRAGQVGPGTVIVTVASDENKAVGGDPLNKVGTTGLVYAIDLDKGARADFFYAAKTTTPEVGDATTTSTIGGGLAIGF
jgi:hypothetical protein